MNRAMLSQLLATLALGAITVVLARDMHSVSGIILFGLAVLATLLSAFRVRVLRARLTRERQIERDKGRS